MKILNLKEADEWLDQATLANKRQVFKSDFQFHAGIPPGNLDLREIFSKIIFWLFTDRQPLLRISSNQNNPSVYSTEIYQRLIAVEERTDNPFAFPAIKFEYGEVNLAFEYCFVISSLLWSYVLYRTDLNAAVIHMPKESKLAIYFNERHVLLQIEPELKRFGFIQSK